MDLGNVLRSVAVFVVLAGCNETIQRSHEHSRHLDIEAYEFRRPLNEVWPKLVEILGEYGYALRAPPAEGVTIPSDLRRAGPGGYRVLTHVVRTDALHFKIRLRHQYESVEQDGTLTHSAEAWNVSGNPTDPVLWALIERVDPATAADLAREQQESAERKTR